jgi:ATP-dependent DNA helicase DinG
MSEQAPPPDFGQLLGLDGPIARALGEYEHRPAQVRMAETVWRAISESTDALIEAGTGTGKSIAYLVPVLLWGEPVIISTANKALQGQLYDKDVPLVRNALQLEFDTVLIKGRQNYVCLRKYQVELPQQRVFAQIDGFQTYDLDVLDDWVRSSDTGDLEELSFVLDSDTRSHITCPPDECLHRECLYYDRCFVMQIRQRAAEARVVITNHHLLISDLQLRAIGGVSLPDTEIVICDEAHHLEDVATSIFETTVTDYTVTSLLLRRMVREHTPESKLDELAAQNRLFFDGIHALMDQPTVKLEGDWEEGIRLGRNVRDLAESMARLNPYGQDPDMEEENTRFGLAVQAIRKAGESIQEVSKSNRDGDVVRFAEQARQRHVSLILHATPISAAESLGEHLFGKHTVICTSATLATGGTFELFKSRCGIADKPLELIGDQVFDFANQSRVYLPELRTYDWENREKYFDAVADETHRLLEVSRGRSFCLFTSWAGMQYVAEKLRDKLPWPVLVQGELPRSELLRLFKSVPHCVLFGTRSFWEGVDVPGDALSLVSIDKLPFPSPRDPLHEARTERIEKEGGNAFVEYTLPLMILALKQGFGRLIRTKTDRGIVAILDNRLTTKRYGSTVLRSLPPAQVTRRFADVHRFFSIAGLNADYALTVWANAAEKARSSEETSAQVEEAPGCHYRWQLTCLPDGRNRSGSGIASDPYSARWAGVLAGVQRLQSAIHKGNRSVGDFGLEIRLPGIGGNGTQLLGAAPRELQECLQAFSRVHVITLESTLAR